MKKLTPGQYAKLALAVILLIYGIVLSASPGTYRFLDRVDLIFHEAGHIVFMPFGSFITILGGTLMQLIMPAAFVVYFFLRRSLYSASVVLFWLGQSFYNVSVYAADARTRALPLITGDKSTHDWFNLLSQLGWLGHDRAVGGFFYVLGAVCLLASAAGAFYFSFRGELPPAWLKKKEAQA